MKYKMEVVSKEYFANNFLGELKYMKDNISYLAYFETEVQ
jgi:hypothetical protein